MSWFNTIATAVAAAITAAPVLGAVGTITATGYGIAAAVGTTAAVADKVSD